MKKNEQLVPKRRFKEFKNDGEWEECTLGDVASNFEYGLNASAMAYDGLNKYIRITDIDDKSHKYKTDEITSPDIDLTLADNYLLREGDLLFARTGASVGKTYKYDVVDGKLYYAGFLIRARIKQEYDVNFIFNQTLTKKYSDFINVMSQRSGQPGVNAHEYAEYPLMIPSVKEQNKIGELFEKIDEMNSLQQSKFKKIKLLKESYLSDMFPKEGEKYPKKRFEGFTGPWKRQKLLESVVRVIDFRGRTPKKLGLDWSDQGYLALSALNVKNGHIDLEADAHYGDEKLYSKWMSGSELHKGQVLFTTEAPMGNVAQVPDDKKYILSQRTIAFVVNENLITEDYLAVVLRTSRIFQELTSISSGGTAKGVSQRTLSELFIPIPKEIKEQIKIGNFFKKLDAQIELEQQKLNKLEQLKQAYLNELFV